MRKLFIIAIAPMLIAFMVSTAGTVPVSANMAQCDDITISNTGAGSENEITCEGDYTITIECSNDTVIVIDVEQDSESGNATVTQNTTGGSASTGDAVNLNDIDAIIENNCFDDEEEQTPVVPVIPTTPNTTSTPRVTPTVAATPKTLATTVTKKPASLPKTGETTRAQIILVSVSGLIALIATAKIAAFAYSKTN